MPNATDPGRTADSPVDAQGPEDNTTQPDFGTENTNGVGSTNAHRYNVDRFIADVVEDSRSWGLDEIELVRCKLRLADTLLGREVNRRGQP